MYARYQNRHLLFEYIMQTPVRCFSSVLHIRNTDIPCYNTCSAGRPWPALNTSPHVKKSHWDSKQHLTSQSTNGLLHDYHGEQMLASLSPCVCLYVWVFVYLLSATWGLSVSSELDGLFMFRCQGRYIWWRSPVEINVDFAQISHRWQTILFSIFISI